MYYRNNDFPKAVHYYQRTLELLMEEGNQYNASQVYRELGGLYMRLGNYRSAMLAHDQLMEMSKQVGDRMYRRL